LNKWWRRGAVALGIVLPLAAVGFLIGMRFAGPTTSQRVALQRMTEPTPPVQGHDASDAIWLLGYDVPVDRWPEVAAATRRFEAARALGHEGLRDPRSRFPRLESPGNELPCADGPGCLDYVTEHRAEVAALLDAHRAGVDAARALAAYDGFRLGVKNTLELARPSFGSHRRLLRADFAYGFASGERLSAVEAVCRHIAGWRRIGGNSDDMVASMVGVGNVRESLHLLTDMLARMPKETELPEDCGAALESSADFEFDLCPALRSEFEMQRNLREQFESLPDQPIPAWAVDWGHVEAMVAEGIGRYCGPAVTRALRADRRAAGVVGAPLRGSDWRRRADWVGCFLVEGGGVDWTKYLDRRADQAQMLALARTVVWLRTAADDPAEVPTVLAHRPRDLGLIREPAYDAATDRISIPLHDASHGARFEIAAGAEPRPTRARHRAGSRRSRGLAFAD
jgi:hypothetical protein